jgi:hypothetical protein
MSSGSPMRVRQMVSICFSPPESTPAAVSARCARFGNMTSMSSTRHFPGRRTAVFYNDSLGEGLGIVHQRREMRAAGNQSGHFKLMVPSIAGKTNAQNTSAGYTHLCHSRYVITHADHLWNSHIADGSSRRSPTQRRACLKTLLGASQASRVMYRAPVPSRSIREHSLSIAQICAIPRYDGE